MRGGGVCVCGGVFDRACKVWRWSGLDLSLPRGGLGRLLPSHEGARECSCHSSGTRSTLFRESVFLQMRRADFGGKATKRT